MDKIRAKRMANELCGKQVGDWRIDRYINCGKSALVFEGTAGGRTAAVKIFDPEIVETYGDQKQLERIEREKSLIGRHHPNLIEIYGGGVAEVNGAPLYFVVMEYFPGKNLSDQLQNIPVEHLWQIVSQIAAAAESLESLGLCHRDIKPENIGIADDLRSVKLLDLGVLRPVKASNLTDTTALPFIGTLRYAPPEFLLRTEEHTTEGWRAVTFYQIGAVLHDLIMRSPLFDAFSQPFARLVNAVQHETPRITSTQVPADLIVLAQSCLAKKPESRLKLVEWKSFSPPQKTIDAVDALRERIARRQAYASSLSDFSANGNSTTEEADWKLRGYAHQLRTIIRNECLGNSLFPRLTVGDVEDASGAHARFSVGFEPSPEQHNLAIFLSYFFEIGWLDTEDEILSIKAHAAASPTASNTRIPPPPDGRAIYQGRFNQETIAASLLPFLYAVFDAAQQLSERDALAETSNKPVVFGMELIAQVKESGADEGDVRL